MIYFYKISLTLQTFLYFRILRIKDLLKVASGLKKKTESRVFVSLCALSIRLNEQKW